MAQELNIGMPEALNVDDGYTIRVTAVDSSGAVVSGVKVATVTLTGDLSGTPPPDGGGGTSGDWFLVPGPGA